MRHSKRMRSPGVWLDEYCWEDRMEFHKRRRRESHSSERENRSRRAHHLHRTYEGYKSLFVSLILKSICSTFICINIKIIAIRKYRSGRHRCLYIFLKHLNYKLEHKNNLKTKISETEHEPNEMFLEQLKKKQLRP